MLLLRKFLSIFLFLSIILSTNHLTKASGSFSDVQQHWAKAHIEYLSNKGIIKGYSDGTFHPEKKLTRAQVALMVFRAKGYSPTNPSAILVTDVTKEKDAELYQAVQTLLAKGLINHLVKDGKFQPNKEITRAEMASILAKAYSLPNHMITPKAFSDVSANHWAYPYIQSLYANGITTGTANGGFDPEGSLQRGHFSAFMARVLDAKFAEAVYHIGVIQGNKVIPQSTSLSTFEEAMSLVKKDGTEVVLKNNRVVWMTEGTAVGVGKDIVKIYSDEKLTKQQTYISPNVDMQFTGKYGPAVKVKISGSEGYVKEDEVKLIPTPLVEGQSYYKVENGDLNLYIYKNGTHYKSFFGEPLLNMKEGDITYSWDGIQFESGQSAHQYYQFLPLRLKTAYTAEQLDYYVQLTHPDSPLNGLGKAFKQAEETYKVNAAYLLAHAIIESGWGKSKIAQDKKNLFGLKAADSNPYDSALSFATFEECIMYFAKYASDKYLTPGDQSRGFYHGAYLGNKGHGMNVMYASDPYWAPKIAGHMYQIDKVLGENERNKYTLAMANYKDGLNVRITPSSTDYPAVYKYPNGRMIAIVEANVNGGPWHKIISEDPNHEFLYVHGDYVQLIKTP